jgi:hypothetical protein
MAEHPMASGTRAVRELLRVRIRPPALRARFLLSAGSSALAILAVLGTEVVARWCAPNYLMQTHGLHVFSDTYGWVPRHGTSAVIEGKRVTFNSAGYRGRELALPKTPDRTRVIVLGDSIAFGLEVSDHETFTHLLDTRENGIEAGNLAVQGYGPDQELIVLANEGIRLDPDVVVLAFCLANDFAEAVLPVALYDGKTPKPRFRLEGDRLVLDDSNLRQAGWRRGVQWLSDFSHVFNRAVALRPPSDAKAFPWRELKREALGDEEYTLRLNLAIVRSMDAACRRRGITFILAVFPNATYYETKPTLARRFLNSVQAEGVTTVDMAERFVALGQPFEAVSLDAVGHLSPLGHVIASQVLEREIASRTPARIATSQEH